MEFATVLHDFFFYRGGYFARLYAVFARGRGMCVWVRGGASQRQCAQARAMMCVCVCVAEKKILHLKSPSQARTTGPPIVVRIAIFPAHATAKAGWPLDGQMLVHLPQALYRSIILTLSGLSMQISW